MYKKDITYNDFNGVTRTESHYFNLMESEIAEMELETIGGLEQLINKIINTNNTKELVELFKKVIKKSYGVKSADGRKFEKSEEIFKEFEQTNAYSKLFMELATDADAASNFINGVISEDLKNRLKNNEKNNSNNS